MSEVTGDTAPEATWNKPPQWRNWEAVVVAAVVSVGLVLRMHDYTLAPLPADNWDEVAFAWSGLTLITRHVPYAWSFLQPYHSVSVLAANGTTYRIVHPYLDHPPLFSLLVGAEAWLLGARDLTDVTSEMIRPVAVVLSSVSTFLAYVLARRVLPIGVAMLAAILLATAPVAVLFGRQVESENLLAPLFLAALIMSHRLLTGEGRRGAMACLALCCLAASLTKVPGVAVGLACGIFLAVAGHWRLGLLPVAAGVTGLLLYAAYGALMDWQLFLAIVQAQGVRRQGVMSAYEFIVAPAGIGRSIRDGWWALGWIGVGALLVVRRPGARLIPWAALVFVAEIMVLADQRVVSRYGWYRIAIYPLVYVGAAYVSWKAINGGLLALLAMLALGGAAAASFGLASSGHEWTPSALVMTAILVVIVVPSAVAAARSDWPRMRVAAQAVAGAAFSLIVLLNVIESLRLTDIYPLL